MPTPNSKLSPDLVEYCKQRTEAAYRMHKWFQESMDMARLKYPLPETNNVYDPFEDCSFNRECGSSSNAANRNQH